MYIKSTFKLTDAYEDHFLQPVMYRIPCKTECYVNGREALDTHIYPQVTIEGYIDVSWPVLKQLQSSSRWHNIQNEADIPYNPSFTDIYIQEVTRTHCARYMESLRQEIDHIEEVLDLGSPLVDIKRKHRLTS